MIEASASSCSSPSTPSSRRELADPAMHADQDRGAHAGPALRRAGARSSRRHRALADARRRPRRPPASWPRGRRRSAPRSRRSRPRRGELEDRLRELLLPRDPNDDKDVILEVKAGEGGEESALFAGDLLRMYLRYAERRGWKTEMLDADRVRPRRLQGRRRSR